MRWLAGWTLVACALLLAAAGVFAVVAASGGAYLSSGAHGTWGTDGYGLATESTNWRTQWLGWAGSVRLRVASEDGKPIFVGVAAPDVIGRYLDGAGYTTIADHAASTEHRGVAPATPPATAVAWTAHAQGVGTQTLRWNATLGRQVAFAMNADGSRPVRVRVESSAVTLDRMPWWVPAGLLVLGFALLPPGVAMLRRPGVTRRPTPATIPPMT